MNKKTRQDADSRRFRLFGTNSPINFMEKAAYKSLYKETRLLAFVSVAGGLVSVETRLGGFVSAETWWEHGWWGRVSGVFPLETRVRGSRVSGVLGLFLWKRGGGGSLPAEPGLFNV
jgi:hypothetical protein